MCWDGGYSCFVCVALLLAGGAFLAHQPIQAQHATPCHEIVVAYPVGDLKAAWQAARDAAREHPGAYAVGESAGGTLALNLAEHRLVRGAIVMGPPVDLVSWPGIPRWWRNVDGATRRFRATMSVRRVRRPTVLVYGEDDPIVPRRRVRGAAFVVTPGGHLNTTSWPQLVRETITRWER
jgi:pimeloyl-ACP methyl ester carboxylesterase